MHFGFLCNNGFVWKVNWWCLKRHYFLAGFKVFVFALALLTLSFLFWILVLLFFLFWVSSLFLLVVVSYIKVLCSGSCLCCLGFLVFIMCYLLDLFFLFLVCFVWRVWGSGEVAQRATSLGPRPSLFVFFWFGFVLFLFVLFFGLFFWFSYRG